MKTSAVYKLFAAVCALLLAAMFLVPCINGTSGSLVSDTISDLGAQGEPHSVIINTLLVCLASGSLTAGWKFYEGFLFHRSIFVLFCVSMILSAFINQAPDYGVNPVDINEDSWHYFFSGTTSLSYIILSLATSFINEKKWERNVSAASALLVLLSTILMYRWEITAGIWSRLMLTVMLGWMLLTFRIIRS